MKSDFKGYQPNDRMRDLVKENSPLILVMGRFGISLGFGEKSVREVCQSHNVDVRTFLSVVNFIVNGEANYGSLSLPSLIGYLKQAHEYYLDFYLPNIRRKLIEAIDCSADNDIAVLIIRFYDEYVTEVKKHMEHENRIVFTYVERLLQGYLSRDYSIAAFMGKHFSMGNKLKELKDIIIRYYPEKNNHLLNAALLEIIFCEQDLTSHCNIEDKLFVPAVMLVERQLRQSGKTVYANDAQSDSSNNDKAETLSEREKDILVCITKGMSNKEIAEALSLSINTITTHRRNITNKLQIHTPAGLVIYAIANKLVNIGEISMR